MGRIIRLLEDGDCVGEVDLETSEAWYDGSSDYVAHVIEKVDEGVTEFDPGRQTESGRPVPAERERTGASLREYVETSIDGDVEYEIVEQQVPTGQFRVSGTYEHVDLHPPSHDADADVPGDRDEFAAELSWT